MSTETAVSDETLLATYVAIVKKGLDTFYEVGTALMQIHSRELYKLTHDTFEAFCRAEFDMTRAHAYRLIAATKITDRIGERHPGGDMPTNEKQVRPLAALPADEQADAWQEAVETAPTSKITAEHVAGVVANRKPQTADAIEPESSIDLFAEPIFCTDTAGTGGRPMSAAEAGSRLEGACRKAAGPMNEVFGVLRSMYVGSDQELSRKRKPPCTYRFVVQLRNALGDIEGFASCLLEDMETEV